MSVAIRLEGQPELPLRSFVCPECGAPVTTRVQNQRTCLGRMCIASRERRIDAEARARRLTGSSAPLLRAATEDTSRTIATVYEVWRSHHARCATCGTYDWFDPGAPRLTDATDIVISRRLTLADGRVVGVVDGPDVAVLCAVGRDRFGAWRAAAMTNLRIR